MLNQYIKFIRERGIPLQPKVGTKGRAFTKEDALKAVDILRQSNVSILGGDVLIEKNSEWKYEVASWHSDQSQDESVEKLIRRSLNETKEFIKNYQEDAEGKNYFILIIDSSIPGLEEELQKLNNLLNE